MAIKGLVFMEKSERNSWRPQIAHCALLKKTASAGSISTQGDLLKVISELRDEASDRFLKLCAQFEQQLDHQMLPGERKSKLPNSMTTFTHALSAPAARKGRFPIMRITFSLLIAYCTLTASLAAAQQVHITPRIQPPARAVAAAAGQWIEVTRTDITQLDRPLRASELRTLGVALGDPEEQARAALESQGLQVRPNNLGGYAVNDAAGNQLMALKIISGHIEQISWLPALASRLAGRAALLFDPSVSDPDSPLRLQLLGREDRRTTESVGGSLFVTYSYDPEGIRLHFPGEHAVVALVFPAKKRQ